MTAMALVDSPSSRLRAAATRARDRVLDALMPPQCLSCRAPVDRQGGICAACWRGMTFIEEPLCSVCGFPFEFAPGADALCGACLRHRPPYERARAVMRYAETGRDLIIGLKHRDRTEAASHLAGWMARAGAPLLDEADLLVPVPLHRFRLLARRFNQAALLALALARLTGVSAVPDAMVRRRATPPQVGLSPAARTANVRGAFAVAKSRLPRIQSQRVLVIDDVMTTGATASACTDTPLKAGAARVDVLTLARVVSPRADAI